MAEFVGLVASIVALTELTGKVIGLGSRYISGVKSAEQDMKALNLELVALASVLKTLQDQANRNYSLVELRVPIQECTKQMRELELQLRPKKRRLINRWKWPLNETHTSKVLESIERSKSLFTLALTAEQL
jgi:hypothetical protein